MVSYKALNTNIKGYEKNKIILLWDCNFKDLYAGKIQTRIWWRKHIQRGTLQTFVVYTVISFIFILIRIFGTLQNPLATGIGVVILCQIAVHLIMKKLKKSSYVQIVHEEYLKMNVEERKKHYKRGLWKLIPIFFYPIIIIAFLKLITVIFQVDSFSCNCL